MKPSDSLFREAFFEDIKDNHFHVLIIDFDHTLLLGNSTELFIDHTYPRGLAWFFALVGQQTARLIFGKKERFYCWRDFFRISFVTCCLPWSYWRWKKNAQKIAAQRLNYPLCVALEERTDATIIIASLGFKQIIAPLLRSSQKNFAIVASSLIFPTMNLRSQGKVAAIQSSNIPLSDALVVSDSAEDLDLINRAGKGYHIEWGSEAMLPPAYFPLRFTTTGKYTPAMFVWQHLQQDLIVICLAYYDGLRSVPLLFLLYLIFFTIYEIGYYENDYHASRSEASPAFNPGSAGFQQYSIYTSAWIWAIGMLFAVGILVSFHKAFLWLGLLVALRGVFYVYNRVAPPYRIPLYAVLQGFKYFGYWLLLVPSPLGICLLAAQAIRQFVTYLHYRTTGKVRNLPFHTIRLIAFLGLVLAGILIDGRHFLYDTLTPLGCLIILWVFYKAFKEIFRGIYRYIRGPLSRVKRWLLST